MAVNSSPILQNRSLRKHGRFLFAYLLSRDLCPVRPRGSVLPESGRLFLVSKESGTVAKQRKYA
jgi:hypothetical protein